MKGPADPAERSVAPEGEVADAPDDEGDIRVIEVTDQEDDVVGLLIKWDSEQWVWADIASYQSLDNTR